MEDTEEIVAVRLNSTDDLFKLMCAMNAVRAEELRVAPIVKRLKAEMKRKAIDFTTEVYVTDRDGQEWEIEIGVSYSATYDPGKYSGPWEDSYPAYGEMDFQVHLIQDTPSILSDKDVLDAAEKDQERIEEMAWEDYHSKKYDGREE